MNKITEQKNKKKKKNAMKSLLEAEKTIEIEIISYRKKMF